MYSFFKFVTTKTASENSLCIICDSLSFCVDVSSKERWQRLWRWMWRQLKIGLQSTLSHGAVRQAPRGSYNGALSQAQAPTTKLTSSRTQAVHIQKRACHGS